MFSTLNRLVKKRQSWRKRPVEGLLLSGFCSADEFQWFLEHERSRTDRTGVGFSLVVFSAPRKSDSALMMHVAEILRRRLRASDVAGWVDTERVGALLPATPGCDAWKVAEIICGLLPVDDPMPEAKVYFYPSDWFLRGSNQEQQTEEPPEEEKRVEALETFFVKPLPAWKRALDIVGSVMGLILFAPLFVIIAVAVKISSPGPVIFKQQRTGLGGKPFGIYKFRTMRVNSEHEKDALRAAYEQDGPIFKIKNDPRVTPFGRLLRRTSIDELPQLWNVFRGDMSLVGPRPLPCDESNACEIWQRRRLEVTPGLTCTWQVSGRSEIEFKQWARMDLHYVQSRSFRQDMKLLFRTVSAVISQRGAN